MLGHIVCAEGILPDPDKIRAVAEFPTPTSVRDVRSFLGLCSYFRRFIRGFADVAEPLTSLLAKDHRFTWTPTAAATFDRLKTLLTSAPVLRHFDPSAPTELHTDASGTGIGAVLAQRFPNAPMENPVAFASRTLTKAERNYSTTEKECLAVVWAVRKFRPYLYGRSFCVVTDHHALCWLTTLKDPSGRLGRWLLRLQEFDMTIKFKSGRLHSDADALSRCPLPSDVPSSDFLSRTTVHSHAAISHLTPVPALPNFDATFLRAEQLKDPTFSRLILHLDGTTTSTDKKLLRQSRSFVLSDGVLYKRNYCPDGARLLLAVPKAIRQLVLRALHDDATAGHLGFFKTYDRVRKRYFWPRLYSTVLRYVNACLTCQRRKPPPGPPAGLLQPLRPPQHPFDRIGIDLFGPLPLTPAGNRWVVVAIDHASRYVECAALPSGSSEEIARFFIHHILLRHGAPRVLVSDRGRSFLAQLLQDIFAACSVVHKPTSAYHPQTNGLTERFNHTLADMLACYISAHHDNWDTVLPYITFAYNSAMQSTTGFSPFRLLYGRDPLCNIDTMFPYSPNTDHNTLLGDATSRAEECRQIARCRTFGRQADAKLRYDERHRHVDYQLGDQVWLWVPIRKPGLSEKLICRYTGPYRIIRRLSDVNYTVEPVDVPVDRRRRTTETVHVTRLKPFVTS